jgi:hypothetical protein
MLILATLKQVQGDTKNKIRKFTVHYILSIEANMRKLILLFTLLIMLINPFNMAFSFDRMPKYSNSINVYGIGVYFAPRNFEIYSEPDDKSKLIKYIQWNNLGIIDYNDDLNTKDVFISFLPDKDIAVMTVNDETDGWYQVVYNQYTGDKGWVKSSDAGKFYSWFEFITKYGKDYGLYLFSDMPSEYRLVHMAPDKDSQTQKDCQFTNEDVKLQIVRGNWMLVKLVDFGKTNMYVGWIRWRSDDGKIYAFPNLRDN